MIAATSTIMERLAFWAGLILMLLLTFEAVAPYLCAWQGSDCHVPDNLVRLLDQNQNTIQNLAIYLFGFLFGTSVGKRLAESTIDKQASTLQAAQAALAPLSSEAGTIVLKPGEQATATATDTGTIIEPKP